MALEPLFVKGHFVTYRRQLSSPAMVSKNRYIVASKEKAGASNTLPK